MVKVMRKPRGRVGIAAAGACALALGAAGVAWAVPETIVANDSTSFTQPTFTMDQGESPTFQNDEGGVPHNVTARGTIGGGRLFRSNTITGPSSAVVNGTQYLTQGSYPFFCSVHPNMEATLQVTGAGTPVARPRIAVRILTRKLKRVRRTGKVAVRIRALTQSNGASLRLKVANRFAGRRANLNLAAGQARRIVFRLNKKARKRLAKRKRARAVLVGSVPFGANARAVRVLK
jgi:plastocyanin